MITNANILGYIDGLGGSAREVFASIVSNQSKATQSLAMTTAFEMSKKAFSEHPDVAPILILENSEKKLIQSIISNFNFVEVVEYMEVQDRKTRSKWYIQIPFVRNLLLKLLGFGFDLNSDVLISLRKSSFDDYLEIGDAIIAAGFYFYLQGKTS
jgi:hypothetical protein